MNRRVRIGKAVLDVIGVIALSMAPGTLSANSFSPSESSVKAIYDGPPRRVDEYTVGYTALVACMAHFVSGENVDYIFSNIIDGESLFLAGITQHIRAGRALSKRVTVDAGRKTIRVTGRNFQRTARFYDRYGCALLPPHRDDVYQAGPSPAEFAPSPQTLANTGKPWPLGERVEPTKAGAFDDKALASALQSTFRAGSGTQALLVVRGGRIILERYGERYGRQVYLNSYSATKSLAATMAGLLATDGILGVDEKLPIVEWQPRSYAPYLDAYYNDPKATDPRAGIRVADLLRMSSGLNDYDDYTPWKVGPKGTGQDELLGNAVDMDSFTVNTAVRREPGKRGVYYDVDPQLLFTVVNRQLAARHRHWRTYLQHRLFDPLGIREGYFALDAFDNMHAHAFAMLRPRDWARIGLLYLRNGDWFGQKILSPEFVQFVRTEAPAWQTQTLGEGVLETGLSYGGGFWVKRQNLRPNDRDPAIWLPKDAYLMRGAGEQVVVIIPSLDLVVVRFGHLPSGYREEQDSQGRTVVVSTEAFFDDLKSILKALK